MKHRILLCLLLGLLGCGNDTQYVFKPKHYRLSLQAIYDEDLVYDVVFDSEEQNIDSLRKKSREIFLKGVDLYKNKHNASAATGRFKSSILVFPDAKTYYELGCALLDLRNTEEAEKAFNIAERLDFQPLSSLCLKRAAVYQLTYERDRDEDLLYQVMFELRTALKEGATEDAIAKDRYLAPVVTTDSYKNMILDMQAQVKSSDEQGLFTLFKNAFREQLPSFEVAPEEVGMKKYNRSISFEFARFIPEMENTSFGRDVSHDFYYVGLVKETESYVALLYTSVSFYEEEMQPTRTMLAVYDQQGNLKAQKLVACQCSAEKIRRCSIKNNEVLVEDFLRVWEKPIDKVPFDQNEVKAHELVARAKFSIDDSGAIIDQDVPAGYSDSTILASAR